MRPSRVTGKSVSRLLSLSGLAPPPLGDLVSHVSVAPQDGVPVALDVQGSPDPHDADAVAPPQVLQLAVTGSCDAGDESLRHGEAAVGEGSCGGGGSDGHWCWGLALRGNLPVCGTCTAPRGFCVLGCLLLCRSDIRGLLLFCCSDITGLLLFCGRNITGLLLFCGRNIRGLHLFCGSDISGFFLFCGRNIRGFLLFCSSDVRRFFLFCGRNVRGFLLFGGSDITGFLILVRRLGKVIIFHRKHPIREIVLFIAGVIVIIGVFFIIFHRKHLFQVNFPFVVGVFIVVGVLFIVFHRKHLFQVNFLFVVGVFIVVGVLFIVFHRKHLFQVNFLFVVGVFIVVGVLFIVFHRKHLFQVNFLFVVGVFIVVGVLFIVFHRKHLFQVKLPFVVGGVSVSISMHGHLSLAGLLFQWPCCGKALELLTGQLKTDLVIVDVQEEAARSASIQQRLQELFEANAGLASCTAAVRHTDLDLRGFGVWFPAAPEEVLQVQRGSEGGGAGRLREGEDGHPPRAEGSPAPPTPAKGDGHLAGRAPPLAPPSAASTTQVPSTARRMSLLWALGNISFTTFVFI
ncbi:uncharacterized protein LOC126982536 isoform X2 [Eriocheir sinensis]|uniref:uncharacterized protein LOC126982536 isoform X2 n=1 Tax=Eriocheir sinensis TaxID=95602 RepID=UPI0021C63615|nr:uncharacterized protein LOC126982536 isoform X2 [Eriocheir sinensis]